MDDVKRLGVEHFNAGRFAEALRCFERALAQGERGPELRCFLAHVLESLGRPEEAAEAFASALAESPRHLPAYAGLAVLTLHRGPLKSADAAMRKALALKPGGRAFRSRLIETLRACGRAWRSAGDLESAEKALRKALLLAPRDAESRRLLVELLRTREEAFLSEDRRRIDALCRRADACVSTGDLEAAEEAAREALALAPGDKNLRRRLVEITRLREPSRPRSRRSLLELLRRRGRDHLNAGRRELAEKTLRKALALDPRDARIRRELVELLRRADPRPGKLELAERALRRALAVDPRDKETRRRLLDVLRRRGRDYLSAGEAGLAEKMLRKALAFDPSDAQARAGLVELLRRAHPHSGRLELAEGALRRALAVDPRDRETRRRLLDVLRKRSRDYLSAGKTELAEKTLRGALAFEPGDEQSRRDLVEVLQLRARAHQSDGRRKMAERISADILKLAPRDARARLSIGTVLFTSGEAARGKALLSEALRLDRGALEPADRFKALMKLGRYKEALAVAERILDGKPALGDIRAFWDPWEWDERRSRGERRLELGRLVRALGPESRTPWLHYYRADLSGPAGLPHYRRLAAFPARRYGWMFFKAATAALLAEKFALAASWFKFCLRHKPMDWRARAFLAETYLCLDRPDAAYAEMERAGRAAPSNEAGQVLAWRGAFDLWLGRYAEALPRLEEACRLGAQCAFCWKGAALLLLGKPGEALEQLNLTLSRYPLDFEAYVWRGEAKRELGLYREALADLDAKTMTDPLRPAPTWLWALFNRALVKAALDDRAGMKADFEAIPRFIIAYIREKTGLALSAEPAPEEMDALLRAGLRLSRGFRREEYRQAIWMT